MPDVAGGARGLAGESGWLLVTGLIVLLVVAAAAVAVVILARRAQRARQAQQDRASVPVDPFGADPRGISARDIGVGAVVTHEGRDWVVRGTLELEEDGFTWHEHHLDDAKTRRWLSVEDDEELEVCLWEKVLAPELEPGPPTLEHAGVAYTLDEHGRARYRATGTTGTPPQGSVEYYDYVAGHQRLSCERYGGQSWEVSIGRVVGEHELDIYPAPSG